jgi:beta-lactamase class A
MQDAGEVGSDPTPVGRAVRRVREEFARVGAQGWLHARALHGRGEGSGEVGVGADEPVVLASVVKVLVVLEYARQSAMGQVRADERTRVRRADRLGGLGTAGCLDDVDISWRDLAWLAMSISDNTAAELLLRRVGIDTVRTLAAELGLVATRVEGGPRHTIETLVDDVAGGDRDVFAERFPQLSPVQVRSLRACDPVEATASTPRDVTALLAAIWSDRAGPAAACAEVRSLMARQANWHRLAAGFPDDVVVAAKTGTLASVRNEAGVVTYPDGGSYAVAVFTAHDTPGRRRPDLDAAIGRAAFAAVTALRR